MPTQVNTNANPSRESRDARAVSDVNAIAGGRFGSSGEPADRQVLLPTNPTTTLESGERHQAHGETRVDLNSREKRGDRCKVVERGKLRPILLHRSNKVK